MCAIAGIIGNRPKETEIRDILESMAHRGPDGRGFFQDRECCLLHSRLSIIDAEGGKQPMELQWGGETYTLVYNGELYNTEEVRRELLRCGHRFSGYSDTEVVLHAYVQWQENCLQRLNGIFAFAIWQKASRTLFLARDRIGVKPLFYYEAEGGFLFASEIKTILQFPGMKPELDREGIAQVVLLGPGRMPGSGVFHGICELEPGCWGRYQEGRWKLTRYWRLLDREHRESFRETAEHVRFLVSDAIRRQMVSDMPLGTFLSGGLDSSLISAVCAGEMEKRGERLRTFSLDFVGNDQYFEPSKFQPGSDNAYIKIMEAFLHSEHFWTVLAPEELMEDMERATWARDLPGMADVDFSLLAFCRETRKHVKVALSGECADEIFGGYPWYRDPEIREKEGFPWAQNTRQRAELLLPELRIEGESYIMDCCRSTLQSCDILPGTPPEERRMKEMVNLNQQWFMQTLLDRKDRMSMSSGLEVRVPFCDYRIAEYLYGVPWAYKDYQGQEKGLLRYAFRELLPEPVLKRKKSPYPKTCDPRYLELVQMRLRDLLQRKDAPVFSMLRREKVREILETENPWPWYGQLMRRPQTIAYILQMNLWMEMYGINLI